MGIHSISTMQEMTSAICSATTQPDASVTTNLDTDGSHNGDTSYVPSTTLTDSRDTNTYTVRKLADGKCWMTQNLNFGTAGTTYDLSPSTTDVASNTSVQLRSWSGSTDSTSKYNYPYIYKTWNTSRGTYYNYAAVSANAITGTYNATAASHSICPYGWKLPTQADYTSLLSSYSVVNNSSAGYAKMISSPLDFTESGYISYHQTQGNNASGRWWSATADSGTAGGTGRYGPFIGNGNMYTASLTRNEGNTVRCVAR